MKKRRKTLFKSVLSFMLAMILVIGVTPLSQITIKVHAEETNEISVTWKMEGGLAQAVGLSETNNTNCVINGDTAELMTDSHAKSMRYTWNMLWSSIFVTH